jgi:hypothetical protein
LKKRTFLILVSFCLINKSFSQKFFETNFSSERNYNQNTIKENGINVLEINEYKASFIKELADIVKQDDYYSYHLEFDKNGNILKNIQYLVIDSLKKIRYKDIYEYNNKNQLIRKVFYDSKDSILKIISYSYVADKLKTYVEQNNVKDTTNQIIYEYDKSNQNIYTIQYDFLNDLHRFHVFEKPSQNSKKTSTYDLNSSSTKKINDSIISKSQLISYSIAYLNNKGEKIKTAVYDKDNMLISESLYSELGKLNVTDNKYYDNDNQLKNRNKFIVDNNGNILETNNLIRKWIAGKVTFEMVKTIYEYDSNFNVIKKNEEKSETNYKIHKDKKQNWILIEEFDSENQLKNLYVRKINYY